VVLIILILLILAAVFGVLAAVVKATLVIVLSILLTIALLTAFGYYWIRYRISRLRRDVERTYGDRQRRSLPPDGA
jgi:O-antigen/teichoic acid export membrane protein